MINIANSILHIVDPNLGNPILSDDVHPLDTEIIQYFINHIEKSFDDPNAKKINEFNNPSIEIRVRNMNTDIDFIKSSKELTELLYEIAEKNGLDPFDLFISHFSKDEKEYLGLFMMNYKISYIHSVDIKDDKSINKIVKQKTSLPTERQRVDEFIIFDLENLNILLKEKKHLVNGGKEFILSQYYLNAKAPLSSKQQIDIVNKASKKIVKDFFNDDVNQLAKINKALIETVEEKGNLDLDVMNNKAFTNPDIKEAYLEEVKNKGLDEKTIEINQSIEKRLPSTQKILLDEGIEIKMPVELINNNDKIEFIVNDNGTISILLKNLKDIQSK